MRAFSIVQASVMAAVLGLMVTGACGTSVVAATGDSSISASGSTGGAPSSAAAPACATYCANPACGQNLGTSMPCQAACEAALTPALVCLSSYSALFSCVAATSTCDTSLCGSQSADLGGCCDKNTVAACYTPWWVDGGTGAASGS
jgi:hypothetical protein